MVVTVSGGGVTVKFDVPVVPPNMSGEAIRGLRK